MKRVVTILIFASVVSGICYSQNTTREIQGTFYGCHFGCSELDMFYCVDEQYQDRFEPAGDGRMYIRNVQFGGFIFDYVMFVLGANDRLYEVDFMSQNLTLYDRILNKVEEIYPMKWAVEVGDGSYSLSGKGLKHERVMYYENGERRVQLSINRANDGRAMIVLTYTDLVRQEKERSTINGQ